MNIFLIVMTVLVLLVIFVLFAIDSAHDNTIRGLEGVVMLLVPAILIVVLLKRLGFQSVLKSRMSPEQATKLAHDLDEKIKNARAKNE